MNWHSVLVILFLFLIAEAATVLAVKRICQRETSEKKQKPEQARPFAIQRRKYLNRAVFLRDTKSERLAEEAISLAQAKTEFLAKVSHELRTPLTSILGVSEMLDYGVYGPLSREQKDAIKIITDCTQHMARLVTDLLEQSQLERGNFKLELVDFVLEDVIVRLRRYTAPIARAKGLALQFEVSPEVPPILHGDAQRVYQILHNLVENAIKYTPSGQVKVRIFVKDSTHCAIQVSDTGIGIPKEMQSVIFDPFLQLNHGGNGNGNGKGNGKEKSNGNGSKAEQYHPSNGFGLGLSIVKQLVSLMNGEIQLTSDEGKGSVFTVILPILIASEQAA
ncbi:MAG: HAMP domain-containing sensor histidine kinase [Anaerolineales bacterium]|nr:HAMP domain-containing sensor histidine kinase [Anaerolineales bacterium]